MSARTVGSLNVGDVTRTATFNDSGMKVTGKIKYVWHSVTHKGEPQTQLSLEINGGEFKVTRPAFTEIDVEEA